METILRGRAHPQQGFRSSLGLMRLGKDYGAERLEAACRRALALGAVSFKSVQAILKHSFDRQSLPTPELTPPAPAHENLRGPDYYHGGGPRCLSIRPAKSSKHSSLPVC